MARQSIQEMQRHDLDRHVLDLGKQLMAIPICGQTAAVQTKTSG